MCANFGIGVRSTHLLPRHHVISIIIKLNVYPFNGKTLKYSENSVFALATSIGYQTKIITKIQQHFFTNSRHTD